MPVRGKVMMMCRARGRAAMWDLMLVSEGSNLNLRVGWPLMERPVVVVAAKVALRSIRRGIKKVAVQPAPRMRMSSSSMAGDGWVDAMGIVGGDVVSCVT